jgi:uncharacterized protein DUF11
VFFRLARAALIGALAVGLALPWAGVVVAQEGADVSLAFSGPNRVKSDTVVVYTITVTNNGPEIATGLFIIGGGGDQFDTLSMHCQDSGSFGQSTCVPSDLAPGASMVATMTVNVCCLVRGESRTASIGASVSAANDPNPDNDSFQKDVFIIGRRIK